MAKVATAGLLVLLVSSMLPVLGQKQQSGTTPEMVKDLRFAPGKRWSAGTNKTPLGPHEVITYTLDEVSLPEPKELVLRGKKERLESVFRLTITGRRLVGAGIIWIDDAALPRLWSNGHKALGAIIYDRSILRDGAEISLSELDGGQLYALPERLSIPENLKATIKASIEEGNSIVGINSALLIFGSSNRPVIQIHLKTNRPFPNRNATLRVQIGKQTFFNELAGSADGHAVSVDLTPKAFADLKDGAEVIVFYGIPDRSGAFARELWYFGRLDKSMLAR